MLSSLQKKLLAGGLVALALFLCFWRLGSVPVAEWDEARYGANAVEMARTHDYVNYHYNGALDLWNAKPPLQVWMIVLSSKIFGANEFSLRFPSAMGILIAAFFLFLIGRDLGGFRLGLLFAATGLLTRAWIGYHVGRSGDMDGLFVAGLAISDFFIRRALRAEGPTWNWLGTSLGLAVAFFAKGFAILLVVPGLAILFFKARGWKKQLFSKQLWSAKLLMLTFIGTWFGLVAAFGEHDSTQKYHGGNSIAVMIIYDVFIRFTGGLGGEESRDPSLILAFLDTRFGALYYGLILLAVIYFIAKKRGQIQETTTRLFSSLQLRRESLHYSLIMGGSFLLILTVSQSKLNWYIAPLAIWVPGVLWNLVDQLQVSGPRLRATAWSLAGLALLMNTGHIVRSIVASSKPTPIQEFVHAHKQELEQAETVTFARALRQDEYLYLLWSTPGKILEKGGERTFPESYRLTCEARACVVE